MGNPRASKKKDKEQAASRFEGSQVSVWDGVIRAAGKPGENIRNFELQQQEEKEGHIGSHRCSV